LSFYFEMDGCNGALVDSVRCLLRTNYATFRISDDNGSTIQNSLIQNSTPANWEKRGITLLNSNTTFRDVTVSGFDEGVMMSGPGNPLLEGCVFTNNNDGVSIYGGGAISDQPNPDFGGGARSGIGGNHFYDNQRTGLRNLTLHTIYARFNTWTSDPPVEGGVDYVSAHGGTVVTQ